MAESFFATLECELLDRTRFETQAQARTLRNTPNPEDQLARDDLLSVVHVVDVPVPLVVDAVDRPVGLAFALALVWVVDRLTQLFLELNLFNITLIIL